MVTKVMRRELGDLEGGGLTVEEAAMPWWRVLRLSSRKASMATVEWWVLKRKEEREWVRCGGGLFEYVEES